MASCKGTVLQFVTGPGIGTGRGNEIRDHASHTGICSLSGRDGSGFQSGHQRRNNVVQRLNGGSKVRNSSSKNDCDAYSDGMEVDEGYFEGVHEGYALKLQDPRGGPEGQKHDQFF